MRRRTIVLGSIALVALAIAVAVLLAVRWFGDGARERLEAILSDALDREVTIGVLDVDAAASAVELRDVVVANPEGVGGAPLLQVEQIRLEVSLQELLGRRIVGQVHARGLDLRIVRYADGTNLGGLLPTPAQRDPDRPPPEVHLGFDVQDSRVVLEDLERAQRLPFERVTLTGVVSNRDRMPRAEVRLGVEEIDLRDVRLRDLEVVSHASRDGARIPSLRASLGQQGRVTGSGHLDMRADSAWSFELRAEQVALDEDITPIVQRLFPLLVTATTTPEDSIRGFVDADVRLEGQGLAWEMIRPSLAGTGTLTVRQLVVPDDALLVSLAVLAGRARQPWSVEEASATFTLAEGWIELSHIEAGDEALRVPVSGRVSFDGELDVVADLMPLVEAFGGGMYEEVARYASSIPVRIGGTVDAPALRPPTTSDIAKSVGGGLLRRVRP